jgi:acetyl esterase/lipase
MLDEIPWGALLIAIITLLAVTPIRRPRALAVSSWLTTCALNEVPFVYLFLVTAPLAATVVHGELADLRGQLSVAIALVTIAGLGVIIRRAGSSGAALERALAAALGPRWRAQIEPRLARELRRHLPWGRILLVPWMFGRRDVVRTADVAYADGGRSNLLDVYRHRSLPTDAPTLVYLHGGRFRWGAKSREARPLLYHLASRGWTCISANYHLSRQPGVDFPRPLVDVKKLIAWVRLHGHRHGADPSFTVLVGASAGAHLAATAALTANDVKYQPGFETVDTSVAAAIGLYGYYGPLDGDELGPTSPSAHVHPSAPPFLVIHGDHDTYTPVDGARTFVQDLRAVSANPVVFAELPGAQHSFDLFHSIRFENVIDAVASFAAWLRTGGTGSPFHDRAVTDRQNRG